MSILFLALAPTNIPTSVFVVTFIFLMFYDTIVILNSLVNLFGKGE